MKKIIMYFKQLLNRKIKKDEFYRDLSKFVDLSKQNQRGLDIDMGNLYPCLYDRKNTTEFDRHYIYHTA
jgi:RNAse (barnase) inhibitor barstar